MKHFLFTLLLTGATFTFAIGQENEPSQPNCTVTASEQVNLSSNNHDDHFFKLKSDCEFKSVEITVTTRWGNVIYTSKDINEEWHPKDDIQHGVYTWTIKGDKTTDKKYETSGHVTILK